jgi:hypothetical protein
MVEQIFDLQNKTQQSVIPMKKDQLLITSQATAISALG